jgi:AcrR family transcriptional regulator
VPVTPLRDSVLDAMRELLADHDWAKVSLSDVAARAGVSRQTLYNEFGSRSGLTEAYAIRLVDTLVDHVEKAVWAHVDDVRRALADAFRGFLLESASDPLVRSLVGGGAKPDLLRLVTVDSAPMRAHATRRLAETFQRSWVDIDGARAQTLARAIVRLALSYVSMPPEPDHDAAADLAALFGPYLESRTGET